MKLRMIRLLPTAGTAVLLTATLLSTSASAFFHLWRFTEFFSNHDGSVQFIELASLGSGENLAQGATIRSSSTGKVFTFPSNLAGNTSNKRLLIATSGFGTLQGAVTPDFTLPSAHFFNPAGDTLTLFAGFPIDAETFTDLPTDGLISRQYNPQNQAQGSLGTNTPTNYSGAAGSVNLSAPVDSTGDYNENGIVDAADYVVWRKTLGETVSSEGDGADGDRSGMIDPGDYTFWRERFGNIVAAPGFGAAAVPEPAAAILLLIALSIALAGRARPARSGG